MRYLKLSCILSLLVLCLSFTSREETLKILLVGDSTTIGNLPRQLNPEGPHLEQMIQLLADAEGLPRLDVINTGKGGETAKRLLGSTWYSENIQAVKDVDYIFLRMGINDWFKCEDLNSEFPLQMKALIKQLQHDHPKAEIVLQTICRFMAHDDCVDVNKLIKQLARDENLRLLDIYTPYNRYLKENGPNSLNVRQIPLSEIPEKYHEILKPYTVQSWWKGKKDTWVVQLNDTSLDPVFGHLKGWYQDRHPNTSGYNLIASETVKFLADVLEHE